MITLAPRRQALAPLPRGLSTLSPGALALRCVGLTLAVMLPSLGAAFLARRCLGALAAEFDDAAAALAVVALASGSLLARSELLLLPRQPLDRAVRWALAASPTLTILLAIGAAWGGVSAGLAILGLTVLTLEEAIVWTLLVARRTMLPSAEPAPEQGPMPGEEEAHLEESHDDESYEEEVELPPGVSQRLLRAETPDGESLHGLVRVSFQAGEAHGAVHVAFCPPFANSPEVEAALLEGDGHVTVAAAEPFGLRLDVRLSRPASAPSAVVIEFLASAAADEGPGGQ